MCTKHVSGFRVKPGMTQKNNFSKKIPTQCVGEQLVTCSGHILSAGDDSTKEEQEDCGQEVCDGSQYSKRADMHYFRHSALGGLDERAGI